MTTLTSKTYIQEVADFGVLVVIAGIFLAMALYLFYKTFKLYDMQSATSERFVTALVQSTEAIKANTEVYRSTEEVHEKLADDVDDIKCDIKDIKVKIDDLRLKLERNESDRQEIITALNLMTEKLDRLIIKASQTGEPFPMQNKGEECK